MRVRGRLYPSDSDWCEWRQDPPLAGAVFVRVVPGGGGRLVLAGLRVDGTPSAELLRSIPVGRIEAAANAQLAVVDDAVVAAPLQRRPPVRPGRPVDGSPGGWEVTDPAGALSRNAGAARRPARSATVGGGAGASGASGGAGADGRRGRPDSFYRDVARAYLDLAQSSTRPAGELAETNGVPVTTAHRWIKEARRRGFLPPGRPGTAG